MFRSLEDAERVNYRDGTATDTIELHEVQPEVVETERYLKRAAKALNIR